MTDEHVHRQYLKEEEFLEDYWQAAETVIERLGLDWQPDFRCNDEVRQRQDMLLAKGKLVQLTFDSGVVFHGRHGFSSVRLYLRSSTRFLVVRIRWVTEGFEIEVLRDREQAKTHSSRA
jgi:hypothetical protein